MEERTTQSRKAALPFLACNGTVTQENRRSKAYPRRFQRGMLYRPTQYLAGKETECRASVALARPP